MSYSRSSERVGRGIASTRSARLSVASLQTAHLKPIVSDPYHARPPGASAASALSNKRRLPGPREYLLILGLLAVRAALSSGPADAPERRQRPLSRGGDNDLDNLLTACRRCNSAKGAAFEDGD